jgi:hypothetical protein
MYNTYYAFDFGGHLQWDCIKSFKLQPLLLLLKWTDDPDLFAIGRDFFNNRASVCGYGDKLRAPSIILEWSASTSVVM